MIRKNFWHLPRFKTKMDDQMVDASINTTRKKIFAALLYASTSFLIVIINKNLLTGYRFPSFQFVGVGQILAAIIILRIGKKLQIISFPDLSKETVYKVWPLPLIYFCNLVFGLGSTKALSIPMLTVLRRFSILMTMIGEKLVLSKVASVPVQMTVLMMIGGAVIAASDDLTFSVMGYSYVLLNDFFTAANAVMVKKKLEVNDLGKYGLLYYNALLMLLPSILLAWYTEEIGKAIAFDGWTNPWFCLQFLSSCVMGFVLLYGIVLCTSVNSPLTTTVIGCLKNILVTYIGMFVGGDYKFSYLNFAGLNISVFGSIVYSYIVFSEKNQTMTNKDVKITSQKDGPTTQNMKRDNAV